MARRLAAAVAIIRDNAPVPSRDETGHAQAIGIDLIFLPGCSPDLNLLDWLGD